jgi:hypothetical protein
MKKYLFISTVVIGLLILVFFSWANKSNSGTIEYTDNNDVLSATKSTTELKTTLFTTLHDTSLKLNNTDENANGPIYNQLLLINKNTKKGTQIGITIANLDGALDESSPVKFRSLTDKGYVRSEVSFAPDNAIVFVKSSEADYELAIIWSNEDKYSAVVGSGTLAYKNQIDEYVNDIVTNWQWL